MILDENKIDELLNIISKNQSIFVATSFGIEFLTDKDKNTLDDNKIDWTKAYNEKYDLVYNSYNFGLLSQAIISQKTNKITYEDFKQYIKSGGYIPLTFSEKQAIKSVKTQCLKDVKTLNGRIFNDVQQGILNNSLEMQQKFIKREVISGIVKKQTVSAIANEIGHKTGDWSRNFDRIVQYISQTAYETGKAALIKRYSSDVNNIKVYKKVYEGACKHCIRLYLTSGLGSEPIVFLLSELEANGTNIGRKVDEYKATLGPTHPHSLTEGKTLVLTDNGWKQIRNINEGDFVLTHTGKYRKVLATIKDYTVPLDYNIKDYYRIKWKSVGKGGKIIIKTLSLTAEHKILTHRGWVKASDLLITDKLIHVYNKCSARNCNNQIIFNDRSKKTCSKKCSNEVSRELCENIWKSDNVEETKDKISQTVKNNWKKGLHINSLLMFKNEEFKEKNRQRMLNGGAQIALKESQKCSSQGSKIQIKLFEKIKRYFPEAQLEYKIFNRSLDIALPDYNIDIEFDGPYHRLLCRKWHDLKRDKLLKSNNWHVIRYSEMPKVKKLLEDINLITSNHDNNFSFNEHEILSIEKKKLIPKHHKLYDIQVEEDESFIARGVVIHNCRCSLQHLRFGEEWNDKTKLFELPKDYKSVVNRKKVRVLVGTKELYV